MIHLTIPGELTDLNTYINAERRNRHIAAKIKKEETYRVAMEARAVPIYAVPECQYPVRVEFTWYTKNLRKDVDNVTFAKKFILDGLVEAGILEDDNRKHVALATDIGIRVDKENPRVEISIYPE